MKILAWLCIMLPVISLGQAVEEDFEDNDLSRWHSNTDAWCISTDDPILGQYSLRHCYDSDVAGTDQISFFHDPLNINNQAAEWQFSISYAFNPSANNRWHVCISNNELPNETGEIENGIVIGVNYEGSDDEIQMAYMANGEVQELLRSGCNWEEQVGKEQPVSFTLQYDLNGLISLQVLLPDLSTLVLGSITASSLNSMNTFTLFTKYTSTYDQGLLLDNLNISGVFNPDQTVPQISSVSVLTPYYVELTLSEPVTIPNGASFSVDNIGMAEYNNNFGSVVELELPHALVPSTSYSIQLPELADVYGNILPNNLRTQTFYYPGNYDILISEIMADPTPVVQLPDVEYIEITNQSGQRICTKNWTISVNMRKATIPNLCFDTDEYLVLCDAEAVDSFQIEARIIGIEDFPALSNSGAQVLLQDASGMLIHSVSYDESWYNDPLKDDGGWALEMIDVNAPCLGAENWTSSLDNEGGTPGIINSVYQETSTNTLPELWRSVLSDSGTLMLYFSEPLDSLTASSPEFYHVDRGIGNPYKIVCSWPMAQSLELFFHEEFKSDIAYTIELTIDILDCSGTAVSSGISSAFQYCQLPDAGDVLINEILFDPAEECVEFIELYNTSEKGIELKDFNLSVEVGDTGDVLTEEYWPILPGEYAVIASLYSGITSPEKFDKANRIILMPSMPALVNSGSDIFLYTKTGKLMDEVLYLPEYHHKQFTDTKGISLERIDAMKTGSEADNWHSASADAGFMTPAMLNSQTKPGNTLAVQVHPQTITPNDDGFEDDLLIEYQLTEPGFMGDVFIYNVLGERLAILVQGAVLGTSGEFIFDGRSEQGAVPVTGYYIVFFRAYNENGEKYSCKKSFVIVRP